MALVLPRDHRFRAALEERGVRCLSAADVEASGRPLRRVGVINLMPKAEVYEELLLSALGAGLDGELGAVEPVWIRLQSHAYSSSDREYLERVYVRFEDAIRAPLAGLILTGAPVEELPFEAVRYWRELTELLHWSRSNIASTLGLCWGGMALAKLMGIEKRALSRKLFGIFELEVLPHAHRALRAGERVWCAQSRHAGVRDDELERAASEGAVTLLARSSEAGHSIFESSDRRFVMHLGHPEYDAQRLVFEYDRDRKLGREDVGEPVGIDLARPHAAPPSHGPSFFAGWLKGL